MAQSTDLTAFNLAFVMERAGVSREQWMAELIRRSNGHPQLVGGRDDQVDLSRFTMEFVMERAGVSVQDFVNELYRRGTGDDHNAVRVVQPVVQELLDMKYEDSESDADTEVSDVSEEDTEHRLIGRALVVKFYPLDLSGVNDLDQANAMDEALHALIKRETSQGGNLVFRRGETGRAVPYCMKIKPISHAVAHGKTNPWQFDYKCCDRRKLVYGWCNVEARRNLERGTFVNFDRHTERFDLVLNNSSTLRSEMFTGWDTHSKSPLNNCRPLLVNKVEVDGSKTVCLALTFRLRM
jgi:hypothetical protein